MTIEIRVLQALRLKGRAAAESLTAAAGTDLDGIGQALDSMRAAGQVEEVKGRFKITSEGRSALDSALSAERVDVDQVELAALYHDFEAFNSEFKVLVTDWQIRNNAPNDHADSDYDRGIVARLADLHERFAPLVSRMTGVVPRLATYPPRFSFALQQVQAGDSSWMARPLIDSYHTVWFELHEDLIGLLGLSRESEAAAGRA